MILLKSLIQEQVKTPEYAEMIAVLQFAKKRLEFAKKAATDTRGLEISAKDVDPEVINTFLKKIDDIRKFIESQESKIAKWEEEFQKSLLRNDPKIKNVSY